MTTLAVWSVLGFNSHKVIWQSFHFKVFVFPSGSFYCSEEKYPGKVHRINVPSKHLPGKKVPGKKVPEKKVPEKKVPSQKVPEKKVPGQKVPRQKVPSHKSAEEKSAEPKSAEPKSARGKSPGAKSSEPNINIRDVCRTKTGPNNQL